MPPVVVSSYVPMVVLRPGKMIISFPSSKLKVLIAAAVVLMITYCLITLKTTYVKNKKLDELEVKAMDIVQMIRRVEILNEKLAMQIAKRYENN